MRNMSCATLLSAVAALVLPPMFALSLGGCAGTSGNKLTSAAAPTEPRITILYDAFGKNASMKKDWGFAALVEVNGKRILFDTGDNPDILAQNVKAAGVDLTRLDFAVISHRHSDHMGGLAYLPTTIAYVPGGCAFSPRNAARVSAAPRLAAVAISWATAFEAAATRCAPSLTVAPTDLASRLMASPKAWAWSDTGASVARFSSACATRMGVSNAAPMTK